MDFWQYNAWCEAYKAKQADKLSIELQASYMAAYWNNAGKKGKSLRTVLKEIQGPQNKQREKIDYNKVADKFRQFEELKNYGRTKVNSN